MYKRLVFSFIFICLLYTISSSQIYFERWDTIQVKENNQTLRFPWAGGLNNAQFHEIDLNGDSIKDLYVFDRLGYLVGSGNKSLTFINGGTANSIDYDHAPEYEILFPHFENFVILKDFDCDGREDIFTARPAGVRVYHNDLDTSGISFSLFADRLYYDDGFNTDINLSVLNTDIPGLIDVNGDGDLDILSFGLFSDRVEYFENQSIEDGHGCDSLHFFQESTCWGYFNENALCNGVTLNITCKGGNSSAKPSKSQKMHSGSNIMPFDPDGDQDIDILIGDVSCDNMVFLKNGGSSSLANITAQDTFYPSYNQPIDLPVFPASFYLDVNNDGLNDIIVASSLSNISDNVNNVQFYENIGSTGNDVFSFQQNNFLQDNMIDVGLGAYPFLFDYNADTLLDLLISNRFNTDYGLVSNIFMYENIGAKNAPMFELVESDYMGILALGILEAYPAFGDLDNDGDLDMMIGEGNGNLHYFENTASSGNPAIFSITKAFYTDKDTVIIDVGEAATPFIIDVDRDGKLDMIIGCKKGRIYYYKNIGTVNNPLFELITDTLGGVDVSINLTGYSTPYMGVIDSTGKYNLIVGSESGWLYQYDDIDGNLNGKFNLVDDSLSNIYTGARCAVTMGDISDNGYLEMVIGNYRGGVSLLRNSDSPMPPPPPSGLIDNSRSLSELKIYPNPSDGYIIIYSDGRKINGPVEIRMFNIMGQQVFVKYIDDPSQKIEVSVAALSSGVYILKLHSATFNYISRVVIQD